MSSTQSLGDYLRRARKAKHMTLREVSMRSGVSDPYISQIENGRTTKPSCDKLWRLSVTLSVPYEALMAKAGLIAPLDNVSNAENNLGELSEDEEKELFKFLEFIRYKELH